MIVTAETIKNGQSGIVLNWVNQPRYYGQPIRKENNKLILTTKEGNDFTCLDMRYPSLCNIKLDVIG